VGESDTKKQIDNSRFILTNGAFSPVYVGLYIPWFMANNRRKSTGTKKAVAIKFDRRKTFDYFFVLLF
jgi:hypothetical protein